MPVIPAPTPTVVPAVPEKTFDRLRLTEMSIIADKDPNGPLLCRMRFKKARVTVDDLWEDSTKPEDQELVTLAMPDLLTELYTRAVGGKPLGAQSMSLTMDFIQEYAIEKLTPVPPPEEEE